MAKHGYSVEVQCPYYRKEDPAMIYCEGLHANGASHQIFHTKADKREFEKQFCYCPKWKQCPIAKFLNEKYEYEG